MHGLAAQLARRGIGALKIGLVETTCGWRVPERSRPPGTESVYPEGLYDGVVGPALALLAWGEAASDARAVALAVEISEGLRSSVSVRDRTAGFYGGLGGVASLHLRLASQLGMPAFVEEASRLLTPFRDGDHRGADLLYGAAGTGLALLQLHQATGGGAEWLQAARRCGEWLADHASRDAKGVAWTWEPHGTDDSKPLLSARGDRFTGFAHGSAGILHFLLELEAADPNRRGRRTLLRDACRWIDRQASTTADGTSWIVSDRVSDRWHQWCHGSTGIAQAYLTRWRRGEAGALARAVSAATFTWTRLQTIDRVAGRGELAGQCHGLAGAIECFLDVHAATGDSRWEARARALVLQFRAWSGPLAGPSLLGACGYGWANGVSGVVLALLRVAGRQVPALHQVEIAAPRPRSQPARRYRGISPTVAELGLTDADLLLVVPPVAAPLAGHPRRHLAVSDDCAAARAAFGRVLLQDPRSAPLRVAVHVVQREMARCARRWALLGGGDVFRWQAQAPMLRDLAARLVEPPATGDTPRHRVAVARFLAERHMASFARMLAHLEADLGTVLEGRTDGPLCEATPVMNDPHRGQQRVFRLRFADGHHWAYKPRDVRVEWFLCGSAPWQGNTSAPMRLNRALAAMGSPARVPTHDVVPVDASRGYAEWIAGGDTPLPDAPAQHFADAERWGATSPTTGLVLRDEAEARRFWAGAGALAACMGSFGVSDLHRENTLAGSSRAMGSPAMHAIDTEIAFNRIDALHTTGLVPAPSTTGAPRAHLEHTHEGLDVRVPEFCTLGASSWALVEGPHGLEPLGEHGAMGAAAMASQVQNPDGSFGYRPYLGAVLRGLIDAWCALRTIAPALHLAARRTLPGAAVRVLARSTMVYAVPRARRLAGSGAPVDGVVAEARPARPFHPEELAQLDALDVPVFHRRVGEPHVWWSRNAPGRDAIAEVPGSMEPCDPPWSATAEFATPSALAVSIRDLVSFAVPEARCDLRDDAHGVRVVRPRERGAISVVATMGRGAARTSVQLRLLRDGRVLSWGMPD